MTPRTSLAPGPVASPVPGTFSGYAGFLARKTPRPAFAGLKRIPELHPSLFPHQRDVTAFALETGRAAEFLDTGLGKTLSQTDWARVVAEHTGRPSMIWAPLAVAQQTAREGARFGIDVRVCRSGADVGPGVNVANYERLHLFDPDAFGGVVLDESSILKSFAGRTRNALVKTFEATPFRLCCTATPSPNDHMELGNHSEFLGWLPMMDMLHRFFVNDTSTASQEWRLKGHAVGPFWDWVSSWARCVSKPSDLGYSDEGFALPPLELHHHVVAVDLTQDRGGQLFRLPEMSATAHHAEKRRTAAARAEQVAALVSAEPNEPWIIWCDTDYEADLLQAVLPGAIEVRGSHSAEVKEERLVAFSTGNERVLITKPSIAGFGLNWQHCARVAFAGLSYSYEAFYQAVRRCWRFGQKRPVLCHVVMAETEGALWQTISRKADSHEAMKAEMFAATRRAAARSERRKIAYEPTNEGRLPPWLKRVA